MTKLMKLPYWAKERINLYTLNKISDWEALQEFNKLCDYEPCMYSNPIIDKCAKIYKTKKGKFLHQREDMMARYRNYTINEMHYYVESTINCLHHFKLKICRYIMKEDVLADMSGHLKYYEKIRGNLLTIERRDWEPLIVKFDVDIRFEKIKFPIGSYVRETPRGYHLIRHVWDEKIVPMHYLELSIN